MLRSDNKLDCHSADRHAADCHSADRRAADRCTIGQSATGALHRRQSLNRLQGFHRLLNLKPILNLLLATALATSFIPTLPTPGHADTANCGELRVLTEGDHQSASFPLAHTRVDARIDGTVSRVSVTQVFINPYPDTIEAIYIFPLPDNAAVDDMVMRVGARTIRGEIKQRDEARRIYQAARDAGHVASLLDQERPNIFTQSVANILPGNRIEITIRYVETMQPENGRYSFTFPMVVGPRYIPGHALRSHSDLMAGPPGSVPPIVQERPVGPIRSPGTGWAPDTDQVPDASRITPPVLKPGERSGHDIELSLSIDGGVPIRSLDSPSHAVDVGRVDDRHATVRLKPFDSIPNRDFVLDYELAGEEPEFAVLTHRNDAGEGYFTALLVPAAQPAQRDIMPKELIFVVDCSGSMRGEPMAKAKQAMRHALKNLGPDDSFQIIRFSIQASGFRPHPVPATAENVREGLHYIERLSGGGGTQMIEGIKAALDYYPSSERLRIVSFMTDGYIGNETEILSAIRQRLGGARLFSFGVGNSVNRYLLDRMAEVGRGAVEYVLLGADTKEVVERFYDRVRSPYLTDLTIDWGGLEVEGQYPERVRDLFLGQTLSLAGRYSKPGRSTVTVRGRLGGRPWEKRYAVDLPASASGDEAIASLWARARIRDLMGRELPAPSAETVVEVTDLALKHRLMTAYTSFVAVEETIEIVGGKPRTVTVPVEMPEGVSYEGVFGNGGQGPHDALGQKKGLMLHRSLSSSPSRGGRATGVASPNLLYLSRQPLAGDASDASKVEETEFNPFQPPVAPASSSVQVQRVGILLSTDHPVSKIGDLLKLTLRIENISNAPLRLPWPLAAGPGGLELSIIDGGWNRVEFSPAAAGTKPSSGGSAGTGEGERTLAPGESVTITIEIPTGGGSAPAMGGYVLHAAGTYHIGVLRLGEVKVRSNRLTLRVAEK